MSTSTTPIPSPSRPTIALQPSTSRDNTSPQAGPSTPRYSTGAARIAKRHHAHPGCTLCSIVSAVADTQSIPTQSSGGIDRARSPSPSPTATTTFLPPSNQTPTSPNGVAYPQPGALPRGSSLQVLGREIVYFDEEITIYKALGKERLCAEGRHLVVVLNRHLESIYELGPADVPTLSHILDTCRHILSLAIGGMAGDAERAKEPEINVGFVGTIVRDPQSSHKHLHAHAMVGPMDTSAPGAGFYRRNVVFGSMNWWSIEDLRAEIRESTSNNRVKSGYSDRTRAPIDRVPDAGARSGLPNAMDDDPYVDSPPPSTSLHPNSARNRPPVDAVGGGKGKERAVPPSLGLPVPQRKTSVSSNGSEHGDEEGYVAVNLQERT